MIPMGWVEMSMGLHLHHALSLGMPRLTHGHHPWLAAKSLTTRYCPMPLPLPMPMPMPMRHYDHHHHHGHHHDHLRVHAKIVHKEDTLSPMVSPKNPPSLSSVMSSVGLATAVCKLLGLLRETILATTFGVGPVVTAFNYSSILPGFFMALLGGVNGPFHVTMATILSKHQQEEREVLVQKVLCVVSMVFGVITATVFLFAAPIIDTMAPGLLSLGSRNGILTREIAILQLKIMSPCVLLAGIIGTGFGKLSAAGFHGLLSLSPSLSSISVIVFASVHFLKYGVSLATSEYLFIGGGTIAVATTIGAISQWGLQVLTFYSKNLQARDHWSTYLRFRDVNFVQITRDNDLHEIATIMLPAIVGSGLLQIATFTDLYFASFIPGAAAALGYANLLVMAPIGVISSSVLLPILSILVTLSEPDQWPGLRKFVNQGIVFILAAILPLMVVVVPLAKPIVEVLFQRYAFDASASSMVSSLLICYITGSVFYVARDLLVRVFYALGDGTYPFYISLLAIIANAFLDWFFVRVGAFGAEGLVMATSLVNTLSFFVLFFLLSKKLGGLDWKQLAKSASLMLVCGIASTIVTQASYTKWSTVIAMSRNPWATKLVLISFSSALGICIFFLSLYVFGNNEMRMIYEFLRQDVKV